MAALASEAKEYFSMFLAIVKGQYTGILRGGLSELTGNLFPLRSEDYSKI